MKKLFIFINLVFIYFIIDFSIAGFYHFYAGSFEINEEFQLPAGNIRQPEEKNFHEKSYYNIIVKRDLFKTSTPAPATQNFLQKPVLNVNQMEITDLQLELIGTITGDGSEPKAVIKNKTAKVQMIYTEGDTIDKAVIKTILRKRVILLVDGKHQVLLMEKKSSGQSMKSGFNAGPANKSGFIKEIPLTVSDVNQLKNNAVNLRRRVRIRPHFSNNEIDGFLITGIQKASVLEKMGLKNGDVVSRINDKEIRSEKDAIDFHEQFKLIEEGKTAVELGIKRRGQSSTIRYSIE